MFEIAYVNDTPTARLIHSWIGYVGMNLTILLSYYTLFTFLITIGDKKYATGKLETKPGATAAAKKEK